MRLPQWWRQSFLTGMTHTMLVLGHFEMYPRGSRCTRTPPPSPTLGTGLVHTHRTRSPPRPTQIPRRTCCNRTWLPICCFEIDRSCKVGRGTKDPWRPNRESKTCNCIGRKSRRFGTCRWCTFGTRWTTSRRIDRWHMICRWPKVGCFVLGTCPPNTTNKRWSWK